MTVQEFMIKGKVCADEQKLCEFKDNGVNYKTLSFTSGKAIPANYFCFKTISKSKAYTWNMVIDRTG